jgi:hypothetical protein
MKLAERNGLQLIGVPEHNGSEENEIIDWLKQYLSILF